MDFAGLQKLIVDREARSVEEVLPWLPPTMRSSYALVFRSRSLQGASEAHPRVLLYGPEARFIVSFNGDAGEAGYNALETMEFDERTKTFTYREIAFPAASDASSPVRFSPPNPARCTACHGTPARPIWDSHPFWPGILGERYGAALSAHEADAVRAFLQEQPRHPRYRTLLAAERFADTRTFKPSARERYQGTEGVAPNEALGAALGRLNFAQILEALAANPRFTDARYLLLGAIEPECNGLAAFYPEDRRRGVDEALAQFGAGSARANAELLRLKRLRAASLESGDEGRLDAPETLDRFRFVVERELRLPTDRWTMALEKGTYDYAWSPGAGAEMSRDVRRLVARDDDDLLHRYDFRAENGREGYCAYLARRSRDLLARADPAPADSAPALETARVGLIEACVGCHSTGVGPPIPFDRPTALAARLRNPGFRHGTLLDEIRWRLSVQAGAGRMPLGRIVDDDDRASLLAYFASLADVRSAEVLPQSD